jgi:serine/threonine-protein kinase
VVIPNTRHRAIVVLSSLLLMPLIIAAGAGLGHPGAGAPFALAVLQMAAILGAGAGIALLICNSSPEEPQVLESEMVGQYALKRQLRVGGMGEIHLAEHILLKRRCAVKLVRPDMARDPAVRRRFEREARAMAALHHPNAVVIHDCGRCPDGTLYYIMEYLPGLSLQDLVKRSAPLPLARVVHLLRQLCDALGEAHGLGILHLDIKPGNAIVGDGDVIKLLDYGLAREVAPKTLGLNSSEAEGAGSPQYMAPEQAVVRGPLDARTDLYGLGGVAYFLLTGRPPFECESALQLVLAHACDPVTPPSQLRCDVPADLEAVVLRCLEKEPARRFADVSALAEALCQCACAGQWDGTHADWPPGNAPTVIQEA